MKSEMQSVLACVDFSAVDACVIDAAVWLARASRGELQVLHVARPDPAFVGYEVGPKTVRHEVAATLRDQHRRVELIAEQVTSQGLRAHPHTLRGPYAETILREAQHLRVAMIVIGTHGHGRLHDLFVGSVVEDVLRRASVPVVVVPHPARQ